MGRTRTMLLAGLLAGVLAAQGLAAVTYTAQGQPLFTFDPPTGWEVREGAEVPASVMPQGRVPAPRLVSLRPPGEEQVMWTGLWAPWNVRDFAEARDYLRRLGPRLLTDPEVTFTARRTVNGLPVRIFAGNGTRGGRDFDFAFAVIQVAPARIAMVAFIGEPGVFDRYEADLSDMLATVRRAGGAR